MFTPVVLKQGIVLLFVVGICVAVVWKYFSRRKYIRNHTYKVVGENGVPMYDRAYPKEGLVPPFHRFLPDTLVVISTIVTFLRVDREGEFWINSNDVIVDGGKGITKNGVLLFNGKGYTTSAFYPKGSPIDLKFQSITYGFAESKGWINMSLVEPL